MAFNKQSYFNCDICLDFEQCETTVGCFSIKLNLIAFKRKNCIYPYLYVLFIESPYKKKIQELIQTFLMQLTYTFFIYFTKYRKKRHMILMNEKNVKVNVT